MHGIKRATSPIWWFWRCFAFIIIYLCWWSSFQNGFFRLILLLDRVTQTKITCTDSYPWRILFYILSLRLQRVVWITNVIVSCAIRWSWRWCRRLFLQRPLTLIFFHNSWTRMSLWNFSFYDIISFSWTKVKRESFWSFLLQREWATAICGPIPIQCNDWSCNFILISFNFRSCILFWSFLSTKWVTSFLYGLSLRCRGIPLLSTSHFWTKISWTWSW